MNKRSRKPNVIVLFCIAVCLFSGMANAQSNSLTAEEHFAEAVKLYNQIDQSGYIPHLTAAIKLKPDYYEAYLLRARAYEFANEREHAGKDYDKAIELRPKSDKAYYLRAEFFAFVEDYDRAIADYSKAIELSTNTQTTYTYFMSRGNCHEIHKNIDIAIADYTSAIKLDPKVGKAFNFRAGAFQAKGDYDGAVRDYSSFIRLAPDYADPLFERGRVYERQGLYDLAIEDLTGAIELDPDATHFYEVRARLYETRAEFYGGLAKADRQKIVELNTQDEAGMTDSQNDLR